jgi:hypothetical protein
VQGAYLLNVVRDDVRGVQVAGMFNIVGGAGLARSLPDQPTRLRRWLGLPRRLATDELARLPVAPSTSARGALVQLAGWANLTGTDVRGLQAAPLLNVARRVWGVQVGLVNTARHVHGVQLGIINIADSLSGVPLGIINIVRHGYWRGEVWASETLPLNAVVKIGVRRYYTLLGISAQPFGNRLQWATSFGIGTAGGPTGALLSTSTCCSGDWPRLPRTAIPTCLGFCSCAPPWLGKWNEKATCNSYSRLPSTWPSPTERTSSPIGISALTNSCSSIRWGQRISRACGRALKSACGFERAVLPKSERTRQSAVRLIKRPAERSKPKGGGAKQIAHNC